MHNQFKTQKFKHLMLAMGPRDLNSAPYRPVHCSSHSMTSFQSSELTELPVVENSQLFAQRTVRPRSPLRKDPSPVLMRAQVLVQGTKVRKHGVTVFGQARVTAQHVPRSTRCRQKPNLPQNMTIQSNRPQHTTKTTRAH